MLTSKKNSISSPVQMIKGKFILYPSKRNNFDVDHEGGNHGSWDIRKIDPQSYQSPVDSMIFSVCLLKQICIWTVAVLSVSNAFDSEQKINGLKVLNSPVYKIQGGSQLNLNSVQNAQLSNKTSLLSHKVVSLKIVAIVAKLQCYLDHQIKAG